MGHFGSLWVVMGRYGSLWLILGHFGSFRVLVQPIQEFSTKIMNFHISFHG